MLNTGGREYVFVLSGDASGVQGAAGQAKKALGDVGDTTNALDHAQGQASKSSADLLGNLVKIGGGLFGLSKLKDYAVAGAEALVQAQINADRLTQQLSAATGPAQAGKELDYVRAVSNRLGLELNSTAGAYARFAAAARGTSLEGRGVRDVFESVAKSAAVMGLNSSEAEGVLRALEQMMSKGTVQAEELRGQLGDRLPGALQIAARAMGVTTGRLGEMVQSGEVISSEFLPRFAHQLQVELGDSAMKAADTMQAATNRMANAWEALKQTIARGPGEDMKQAVNGFAAGLRAIEERMKMAQLAGEGFTTQLAVGFAQWAIVNPLGTLTGSAVTLEGRIREATDRLRELDETVARNPHDVYIIGLRNRARELVDELTRVNRLVYGGNGDQSDAETARLSARETATRRIDEASARRKDALSKVTEQLTEKNHKLVQSIKVLTASYQAGELARSDFDRLVKLAYEQGYPQAAGKAVKDPPLVDQTVLDRFDGQARIRQRAFEADTRTREFMLGKVQASDEKQMQLREKQLDDAAKFTDTLVNNTAQAYASIIPDAEGSAYAQLAIERAKLSSQLHLLKLEGNERRLVEDEISRYIIAREAQITEQLKPEWQRRLEAWQDTTHLMKDSYDTLMGGIVDQGEQAFTEWLKTGKLSAKNLVAFIGDEFAKLTYRRFLANTVSQGADTLLGFLGLGAGALTIDSGGLGIGGTRSDGLIGLPTRGGAATGSNYVERDMLTILHKGEAVIPRAFNPYGAGQGGASVGGSVVQQTNIYNVPPGQSPAAYAAALEQNNQRLKADIAADLVRPGRPLQRAAARGSRF